MKPLKLMMQAFGPYAEVETIDFTELGNRTMFVISGNTGSGKTTIFDAISYAIYGKASGEDRNGPELRSQFAKEDLLTQVSLDFSLRSKVFSITRLPQQLKKKDKGEGYTTIPAKAELSIWGENGEKKLIASKINDVEEKIKEIMLIDSNQFRQILMIPQGEFRKLLTSDSKDKEVILQRLFHTQIYKMVEDQLKAESSDLKKSVEDQVLSRNEAMRRIQAVTNESLKEYVAAESVNDTIMMPLLQEEIAGMTKLLDQLNATLKEKELEQDRLKAQLFEAETTLKQLQTKETLKLQKGQLEEQREVFVEKEKQVQLAQKAALLAKQEELCHRLKREVDQVMANVTAIKTELNILADQRKQSEERLQTELAREPERQACLDEMNRLVGMKEDVYSFAALGKETAAVEALLKTSKAKQGQEEKNLQLLEERLNFLQQQKLTIEQGQLTYLENERQVERLQAELDRIEKYEAYLTRHQKAVVDFKDKTGRYENSLARFNDSKVFVEELENKWMHGQAALLAARLQTGEACPVCGSEHHPSPASDHQNHMPNEEDLKTARMQAEALEKEKSMAESSYYQSQSAEQTQRSAIDEVLQEIRAHRADFEENRVDHIKSEVFYALTNLVEKQRKLSEQIKQLEHVKLEIEKRETEKQKIHTSIQQLLLEVTDLTVQYTEKKTNLTRMMTVIPENLRSEAAYEKTLSEIKKLHEQLIKQLEEAKERLQSIKERLATETARLQDAEKYHSTKQDELTQERESFKNMLTDQGFENYNVYHSAKKSDIEVQQLELKIRKFREDLRSVTDRLQELTELLKDVKTPDVEGLKAALEKVHVERESINQQRTDLFVKKRDNEEIYARVVRLNDQMKVLEERYKLIGHLHDIARGQNNLRVTFERFVLASFLDNILREANGRLRKMTAGRFQLLRKTDKAKGNAQSGLELLVYDQYTGQERHVKTLSGGESFKAALSLALGLADVVQNYAGGVSLETMFIDEGFGTLDPESLEQAIETLIDIQSSGRLVGIISHVPELKERIDVRLEVTSGQTGSKTEFMFTN
ncbi:SbcC/MukB-like Walker B domain-containing protein [Bacillus sp. MRMR6]|uniref:SbcC/MukB-like Walker B domain-containing protein n=1 Tax=Bacillus sp. MRMR6 TaxID=1928617 RepID=UPI00095119E5|nr:SMC family ATPase [Bacillus sp. MRMR6]OLS36853.1 ATP-dependent dsDNA exonuclease [Bacillus sp. MRMR6]